MDLIKAIRETFEGINDNVILLDEPVTIELEALEFSLRKVMPYYYNLESFDELDTVEDLTSLVESFKRKLSPESLQRASEDLDYILLLMEDTIKVKSKGISDSIYGLNFIYPSTDPQKEALAIQICIIREKPTQILDYQEEWEKAQK